ncbi:MAG TPA: DUF1175 family protein [Vicinamibacterales bacterium]|nr:DUF1175 family protein [Vicinamibacterales bacterium]
MSHVLLTAMLALSLTSLSAQVRLSDASDRAAFRSWFALLADLQFDQPVAEVTDCAGLIRFAYREALRAHTPDWARRIALPFTPTFPDVRSGPKPTSSGWPLFRVGPGDAGRFAEFADARTLIALNTRPLGRDIAARQPGGLLYYRQPAQSQPDHLMVFVGRSHFDRDHDDWVVYHTGAIDQGPGEVRKVRLADLLQHPAPRWRPLPSNPQFAGVFRWAIL